MKGKANLCRIFENIEYHFLEMSSLVNIEKMLKEIVSVSK